MARSPAEESRLSYGGCASVPTGAGCKIQNARFNPYHPVLKGRPAEERPARVVLKKPTWAAGKYNPRLMKTR